MKVKELIEKLKEYDQDTEVHICANDSHSGGTFEADSTYESSEWVGVFTKEPRKVPIIVIDTMFCGL